MHDIELYSAALCPFAQRTRLALAEKGLRAREIEIDPRNKPAGFLDISPLGKVPVLRHAGRRVWESAIINEYLEEAFPATPLLPQDPLLRAHARIWVQFADSQLYATTATLLHSFDPAVQAQALAQLTDHLRFLELRALAPLPEGPYWLGREVSLADLAFYPWFEQVAVLERYWDFQIPADCSRLIAWRAAVGSREAIRETSRPAEFYLERYGMLLQAVGHPAVRGRMLNRAI